MQPETIRTLTDFLGVIAVLISGFLGLHGLGADYTDKVTGKLTRKGGAARVFLVIALAVALVAQAFQVLLHRNEETQSAQKAAAAASQTLKIVSGIERLVTEVPTPQVSAFFAVPLDTPFLAKYRHNISRFRLDKAGDTEFTREQFEAFAPEREWYFAASQAFVTSFMIDVFRAGTPVPVCMRDATGSALTMFLQPIVEGPAAVVDYSTQGRGLVFPTRSGTDYIRRDIAIGPLSLLDFSGAIVRIDPVTSAFGPSPGPGAELVTAKRPVAMEFEFEHSRSLRVEKFETKTDGCTSSLYFLAHLPAIPRVSQYLAPKAGRPPWRSAILRGPKLTSASRLATPPTSASRAYSRCA